MSEPNKLHYGDCLTIMSDMPSESVDLIYLDPPFNSKRDYNAIYKTATGRPLPDQVQAFSDTWKLDSDRERSIQAMPLLMCEAGIGSDIADFWRAWSNSLRKTNPTLLAYLSYMTERLLPMRRVLKDTGSIYLHCDPTASHYIKVMLDSIFGNNNFLNEIVWSYRTGGGKNWFSRKHDTILLYARKKGNHVFNVQKEKSYTKSENRKPGVINYGAGEAEFFEDENGVYNLVNMRDVWDISYLNSQAKERLGYATQKPVTLLERIITASSNEGGVIFDPFCGCATTIEAAQRLNRKWIGIDIAIHAIKRVASLRLKDRLGLVEGTDFIVSGVPRDMDGAKHLWKTDKYQFQKWAVEQVDGFVTHRRSGDGGVDGRLYFAMPQKSSHEEDPLQSMIIEVKGGKNVGIDVIRDLRGTLERENSEMAGLIVLEDLGDRKVENFRREMAAAGDLDVFGKKYPRMQMLTVREILDSRGFQTPGAVARASGQDIMDFGG